MKNYIETDTITENAGGDTVTEVTETAEAAETEKRPQSRQRAKIRQKARNPRMRATLQRQMPKSGLTITSRRTVKLRTESP